MSEEAKVFEEMEGAITEELTDAISNFIDNVGVSTVRNIQPPESVVQAMAEAAAKVLIAFEHGYRLGG